MSNDLRYAWRQLRHAPGYTLTAILTLGLALGGAVALWGVVQQVLLAPLPYREPGRLVGVAWQGAGARPNASQTGAGADFVAARLKGVSGTAVLEDTTAASNLAWSEGGSTHTALVASERVSRSFFPVLGVEPMLGRGFAPEEDLRGGPRVVVLSYGLWQRVFAGDARVLGRPLRLNGEAATVIGVMGPSLRVAAESMTGHASAPDLWEPLRLSSQDPGYDGDNYEMVARLKDGATLAGVQAELDAMREEFYREHPVYRRWEQTVGEHLGFAAWPLGEVVAAGSRRSLLTLLGAATAVLLVAALNLAGLNVARTVRRRRELAVREALGASRVAVLRLLVAESALLAGAGAVVGVLVASVAGPALVARSPVPIPLLHGRAGVLPLLPAACVLSLGCALLFGLLPALAVWGRAGRGTGALRASAGAGLGRGERRLGGGLIVTQVAVATMLLGAAALLVGSFLKLRAQPVGIDVANLLVAQVTLKGGKYATASGTNTFLNAVLRELEHAPGVRGVAAVSGLPLDRGLNEGAGPADRPELRRSVEVRAVTPGYFVVAGIPLLAGRPITEADRADGEPVLVVSRTAARRWWPGRSPLGQSVNVGRERSYRVVGMAADTRASGMAQQPEPTVYLPFAQVTDGNMAVLNTWISTSFALRTSGEDQALAAAVARAIASADPELPVARMSAMRSFVEDSLAAPKFFSSLAGAFASFAMLLALLGLFGLLSYGVTARTREIGLRMAVGADRWRIVREVMASGVTLCGAGLLLGSAGTWVVRRAVASVLADSLYTGDAPVAAWIGSGGTAATLAAALMLVAACAASWVPARRAASVEPTEALRAE